MNELLIKGGRLVNPLGAHGMCDVLISDGLVKEIGEKIECEGAEVIDASGKWVMPGFVDMHVHLREPGYEYKEDIESGTLAAVHGGFTAVACMANTDPVNDDATITRYILERAKEAGRCRVYPIAALTKGLKGEELTEIGRLKAAGAVAFSDDGKPVNSAQRMRLAMQYAKVFDALIISHCEELSLAAEGLMHEGYYSAVLGLKGIPAAAEEVMIAREIALATAYGARVHIAHVSTAGAVDIIRTAKAKGVRITAETAPHYFTATDEWVQSTEYDSNTKMNPPLRSESDRLAIIEGLKDGTIDAVATDHAPHHIDEKRVEFASALNGIVGLETAFSLAITNLLKPGHIDEDQLVCCMSSNPAKILGVTGGTIAEGAPADIVIADADAQVSYSEKDLHSKSKNSPFLNKNYFGKIEHTIVGGVVKV